MQGECFNMNKLTLYHLMLIFFCAGFNQILYISKYDVTYNSTVGQDISGSHVLNETTTELELEDVEGVFDINMVAGLTALIIGLTVLAVTAGITILGSGLKESSINVVYKAVAYYGLWGIFSALSFAFFLEIPMFGLFMWIALTVVYTLGYFQSFEGF